MFGFELCFYVKEGVGGRTWNSMSRSWEGSRLAFRVRQRLGAKKHMGFAVRWIACVGLFVLLELPSSCPLLALSVGSATMVVLCGIVRDVAFRVFLFAVDFFHN